MSWRSHAVLGGSRHDRIDLRYLKNGAARAVRTLRAHRTPAGATGPAPTARGASTTAVMLAGNWKTARMVAHYYVPTSHDAGNRRFQGPAVHLHAR